MGVEREVQVLPELSYRGAAPVFKHMQVGLAFILQTHTDRGSSVSDRLSVSLLVICQLVSTAPNSYGRICVVFLFPACERNVNVAPCLRRSRPSWIRKGDRVLVGSICWGSAS